MDPQIEAIKYQVAQADYELKKLKRWIEILNRTHTKRYPTVDHYKVYSKLMDLEKFKRKRLNSKDVINHQAARIADILGTLTEIHGHSPLLDYLKEINYEVIVKTKDGHRSKN